MIGTLSDPVPFRSQEEFRRGPGDGPQHRVKGVRVMNPVPKELVLDAPYLQPSHCVQKSLVQAMNVRIPRHFALSQCRKDAKQDFSERHGPIQRGNSFRGTVTPQSLQALRLCRGQDSRMTTPLNQFSVSCKVFSPLRFHPGAHGVREVQA